MLRVGARSVLQGVCSCVQELLREKHSGESSMLNIHFYSWLTGRLVLSVIVGFKRVKAVSSLRFHESKRLYKLTRESETILFQEIVR